MSVQDRFYCLLAFVVPNPIFIKKFIAEREIRKVIVVPGRLVNIVVS